MISYCQNNNHPDRKEVPNFVKVKGDLEEKILVIINDALPSTSSKIEVNFLSTNEVTIDSENNKVEWYRKETSSNNSNVLSKKTMVQDGKYLCSPKDLGFQVEAHIVSKSQKSQQAKMVISYGPILLSNETEKEVQKAWKDQQFTLACKGVIISTKETFACMVINKEGVSCRSDAETEVMNTIFEKVTHCEASSTDETTLKLRFSDIDLRVSIKDILVRDVVIQLINKFRKRLMKDGNLGKSKDFDQSEISNYQNHNANNFEETSILQNVNLRKNSMTTSSQPNIEFFGHQSCHKISILEENIKCLTQEGRNYQVLIESLQRELAYLKRCREEDTVEYKNYRDKTEHEYNEQITMLHEKISQLKLQNEMLQEELDQLRNNKNDQDDMMNDKESELYHQDNKLEEVDKELEFLKLEIETQTKKQRQSEDIIEQKDMVIYNQSKNNEELQNLKKDFYQKEIYCNKIEIMNEEYKLKLDKWKSENFMNSGYDTNLITINEELKEINERLTKDCENYLEENRGLKREYDELLDEYTKKGVVLDQFEKQNKALNDEMNLTNKEEKPATNEYDFMNNTIVTKTKEQNDLQYRYDNLIDTVQDRHSNVANLNVLVNEKSKKIEEILTEKDKILTETINQNQKYLDDRKRLETEIHKKAIEVENLKKDRSEVADSYIIIKEENHDWKNKNYILTAKLVELQRYLENNGQSVNIKHHDIKLFMDEQYSQNQESEYQMTYELDAQKNKIASLSAMIEDQQMERDQIFNESIKKENVIADLELKVAMLAKQLLEREKVILLENEELRNTNRRRIQSENYEIVTTIEKTSESNVYFQNEIIQQSNISHNESLLRENINEFSNKLKDCEERFDKKKYELESAFSENKQLNDRIQYQINELRIKDEQIIELKNLLESKAYVSEKIPQLSPENIEIIKEATHKTYSNKKQYNDRYDIKQSMEIISNRSDEKTESVKNQNKNDNYYVSQEPVAIEKYNEDICEDSIEDPRGEYFGQDSDENVETIEVRFNHQDSEDVAQSNENRSVNYVTKSHVKSIENVEKSRERIALNKSGESIEKLQEKLDLHKSLGTFDRTQEKAKLNSLNQSNVKVRTDKKNYTSSYKKSVDKNSKSKDFKNTKSISKVNQISKSQSTKIIDKNAHLYTLGAEKVYNKKHLRNVSQENLSSSKKPRESFNKPLSGKKSVDKHCHRHDIPDSNKKDNSHRIIKKMSRPISHDNTKKSLDKSLTKSNIKNIENSQVKTIKEIKNIREKFETYEKDIRQLETEKCTVSKELVFDKEMLKQINQNYELVKIEVTNFETQTSDFHKEIQKLNDIIKTKNLNLVKLEENLQKLNDEKVVLTMENKDIKISIDQLVTERTAILNEKRVLKNKYNELVISQKDSEYDRKGNVLDPLDYNSQQDGSIIKPISNFTPIHKVYSDDYSIRSDNNDYRGKELMNENFKGETIEHLYKEIDELKKEVYEKKYKYEEVLEEMDLIIQDNKNKETAMDRLNNQVSLLKADWSKKDYINQELNVNTKYIKQDLDEKQEFISELKQELQKKDQELTKLKSATKKSLSETKKITEQKTTKKELVRKSDTKETRKSKSTTRQTYDSVPNDAFFRDSGNLSHIQLKKLQTEIDDVNTHKNYLQICLDKKNKEIAQHAETIKKHEVMIKKMEKELDEINKKFVEKLAKDTNNDDTSFKITELESLNRNLQEWVDELRKNCDDLQKSRGEIQQDFNNKVDEKDALIHNLQKQLEIYIEKINILTSEYEFNQAEISKSYMHINQIHSDSKNREIEQESAKKEQEIYKKNHEDSESKIQDYEFKIETQITVINEKTGNVQDLQQMLDDNQNKLTKTRDELEFLESEIGSYKMTIEEKNLYINSSNKRIEILEADKNSSSHRISENVYSENELRNPEILDDQNNQIEALNQEIESNIDIIFEKDQEISLLKREQNATEIENNNYLKSIEVLNQECATRQKNVEVFEKEMQLLQEKYELSKIELQEKDIFIRKIKQDIEETRSSHNQLEEDLQKWEQKYNEVEYELQQKIKEMMVLIKSKGELQNKNEELQNKNEELQKKYQSLESTNSYQISDNNGIIDQLNNNIRQLNTQNHDLKEYSNQLIADLNKAKEELDHIKTSLSEKNSAIANYEEKISKITIELELKENKLIHTESKFSNIQHETEQIKNSFETQKLEYKSMNSNQTVLQTMLDDLNKKILALQNEKQDLEQKLSTADQMVSDTEELNDQLRQELEQKYDKINEMEYQLSTIEKLIEGTKLQNNTLNDEVESRESTIKLRETYIETLETKNDQLDQQQKDSNMEIENLHNIIEISEKECEKYIELTENNNLQISELMKKVNAKESEISELSGVNLNHEQNVKDLGYKLEFLTNKNNDMKNDQDEDLKFIEELKVNTKRLENSIKDITQNHDINKKMIDEKEFQIEMYINRIAQKEEELQDSKKTVTKKDEEIESVSAKLSNLAIELSTVQNNLNELKQEKYNLLITYENSVSQVFTLTTESENKSKRITVLHTTIDELNEEKEELKQSKIKMQYKIDESVSNKDQEVYEAKNIIKQLTTDIQDHVNIIERLESDNTKFNNTITLQTNEISELKIYIEKITIDNNEYIKRSVSLESELNSIKIENDEQRQIYENLIDRNELLEEKNVNLSNEILNMNSQINEYHCKLLSNSVLDENKILQDTISTLNKEITIKEEKILEYSEIITSHTEEVYSLKTQANREVTKLREEITKKEEINRTHVTEIERIQIIESRFSEEHTQKETLTQEKIEYLEQMLQEWKEQVAQLKSELATYKNDKDNYVNSKEKWLEEKDRINNLLLSSEKQNVHFDAKVRDLEDQLKKGKVSNNVYYDLQEKLEIQIEINKELKEKFVKMEEEQNRIVMYWKERSQHSQAQYNCCGDAEKVCYEHRQIEETLNERIVDLEDQIISREDKIEEITKVIGELKEALRKTIEREEHTVDVTKRIMNEKDEVIKKLVEEHNVIQQRNDDLDQDLDTLEEQLEEMTEHRDRLHKLIQRE